MCIDKLAVCYIHLSLLLQKIYGVSIHPEYGGWFAFRAVLILPGQLYSKLTQPEPTDVVPTQVGRIKLLDLFNFHWRDNRYRDIIPTKHKYCKLQQLYFNTTPKERQTVIDKIRDNKEGGGQNHD